MSLDASIASAELFTATTAGTYGPTTQAAVAALLNRFGFSQLGQPQFDAHVGRLLNIAVAAELGSTAAVKKAVRQSGAVIQTAPVGDLSELAWTARYATIGRGFRTASKTVDMIPDNSAGKTRGQCVKSDRRSFLCDYPGLPRCRALSRR